MKNKLCKIILFLAIFFLPVANLNAAQLDSEKIVHILPEEIVSQTIYTVAEEIIVDGTINGDLVATAKKIIINGKINGDLLALGQVIIVNGQIDGNIRIISSEFYLNGSVARNLNALAEKITLAKDSRVFWDVALAGQMLNIEGKVDGLLQAVANQVYLSGIIDGDLNLKIINSKKDNQPTIILSGATIYKNFTYQSPVSASINETSSIKGEIKSVLSKSTKKDLVNYFDWSSVLYKIMSAFIIGLILLKLISKYLPGLLEKISKHPHKLFIPGLIIFFGGPIIILLLIISIIGIPLALILTALWLVAQYLAKILIAFYLGKLILENLFKKKTHNQLWSLALGLIIIYLLFTLPFVGWIASLATSIAGLGAIYLYATNQSRNI